MAIIHILTFLSLMLVSISRAFPLADAALPSGISVKQIRNAAYTPDFQRDLYSLHNKYNSDLAIDFKSKLDTRITANETVAPTESDNEYISLITIDGQTYKIQFDTGSWEFIIPSIYQPKSQLVNHPAFNPAQSPSFKLLQGYIWNITYADGATGSGIVGTNTVSIGGGTVTQALALATALSFSNDTERDGLMGLAPSSGSRIYPVQQANFFENLTPQLPSPLFTVDLHHQAPGTYDFGYIDSSKYTGSITYVAADFSNNYWQFPGGVGYTIGNGPFVPMALLPAIADSAATLVLLESDLVRAYYAQVPGSFADDDQGGYVFPCNTKLPDFKLRFGNYDVTLKSEFLNYGPLTPQTSNFYLKISTIPVLQPFLPLLGKILAPSNLCFGFIQNGPVVNGVSLGSLVGAPLFKSNFVVFDDTPGAPKLGFAQKSSLGNYI